MWRFYFGLAILVFLILYLPTENALVTYLKLSDNYKITFAVITIFITSLFMIVALPDKLLHEIKNLFVALFVCVNMKSKRSNITNEPHNNAEVIVHEQCCCHATQSENFADVSDKGN